VSAENTIPDAPVWDEHALDELREIGGDELVKHVVRQSIRDAEERIDELSETCPEAGASTWREAAHALHGVALSIGAIRLSQIVAETLQREKLEHAQIYVGEFTKYFAEVRVVLEALLV
jgi:HPt (histidine-containing phosphotransfer) domain-containing protein